MKIVLLGCSYKKRDYKTTALDLYSQSPLFRWKYRAAEALDPDKIFIISGKYNLLHLNDIIAPYDHRLKGKDNVQQWSELLIKNLENENIDLEHDEIYIFAGKPYYNDYLLSKIKNYHIVTCKGPGGVGRYYSLYKKIIETGKYED